MPSQRDHQRFLLAVWRPARFERQLTNFAAVEATSRAFETEDLHEQMYIWSPDEDVWGGIRDSTKTNVIRTVLVEGFSPFREPQSRGMAQLREALNELREVVYSPDAVDWSECEAFVNSEQADSESNLRANTLLALYLHLHWLHRVFENVPGASVTIR